MRKYKKIYLGVLAFIIPICMFLLVMYLRIGSIDGNYIMISDMQAQYSSLFQYLKNVLTGTESLFYSFNKGFGGEMFTTFTYYLSSPLNLLVLLFKDGQIPNCILLIVLIKLGLCGFNMNIYLNYRHCNNYKMNLLFSIIYSLMGYTVNYYFNIMWLDAVYMLPLVILGIEKLVDQNKPLMYIIALSYTIIANYYTGYMVCIFALLYFIYQCIIKNKNAKKIIINFLISSILAAGISSFILIPTLVQIPKFASVKFDISINLGYIIEVLKGLINNMIIGMHNCKNITNQFGTYTYVTNFILIMLILYFMNKNITFKEKIASFIFIDIFLISFLIMPVTYIWHGFSMPNFFNNRNSFLFNFFMISLTSYSYIKFDKINVKNIIAIITFYAILLCSYIILNGVSNSDNLILTIILVIIYCILLYNYKKNNCKLFKMTIYIFIILELFINLYSSFVSKNVIDMSYEDYKNNVCTILSDTDINYHASNTSNKNGVDGLMCQYSASTSFLSTITQSDIEFFNNVGYYGRNKFYYNTTYNTPLIDSIMSIKYYFINNNKDNSNIEKSEKCSVINFYNEQTKEIDNAEYCLYENNRALSLGYIIKDINVQFGDNAFENQNNLFKTMAGIQEDYLTKLKYEIKKNNEYIVDNKNKTFYMKLSIPDSVTEDDAIEIYVDDNSIYDVLPTRVKDTILKISSNSESTNIKINVSNSYIEKVEFYQSDETIETKILEELTEQQLVVKHLSKQKMNGTIDVKRSGYLLLTVPFDKNIKVYVDGQEMPVEKAYNYFLAIKIEEGNYDIEIKYNNKIYSISMILSMIFIINSIIFVKKCKKI